MQYLNERSESEEYGEEVVESDDPPADMRKEIFDWVSSADEHEKFDLRKPAE